MADSSEQRMPSGAHSSGEPRPAQQWYPPPTGPVARVRPSTPFWLDQAPATRPPARHPRKRPTPLPRPASMMRIHAAPVAATWSAPVPSSAEPTREPPDPRPPPVIVVRPRPRGALDIWLSVGAAPSSVILSNLLVPGGGGLLGAALLFIASVATIFGGRWLWAGAHELAAIAKATIGARPHPHWGGWVFAPTAVATFAAAGYGAQALSGHAVTVRIATAGLAVGLALWGLARAGLLRHD